MDKDYLEEIRERRAVRDSLCYLQDGSEQLALFRSPPHKFIDDDSADHVLESELRWQHWEEEQRDRFPLPDYLT